MMLINLYNQRLTKTRQIGISEILLVVLSLGILASFRGTDRQDQTMPTMSVELEERSSGELSLLTYNIAGLPEWISSAETPRSTSIREIGRLIENFDLVNLQEDFNYNRLLYLDNAHPFRTVSKGSVPFGDGLSTLSNYPILEFERMAWQACSGSDCLTPKGFTFMRVLLAKNVSIDVYNLHATAQNNVKAIIARGKNLDQLAEFMQAYSAGRALIIMGDFNAHYAFWEDRIADFSQQLNLRDGWVDLNNNGELPEKRRDFVANHALDVHDKCESIDKIFIRDSEKLKFTAQSYKVEQDLFSTADGRPLSDHCAISLQLGWEVMR